MTISRALLTLSIATSMFCPMTVSASPTDEMEAAKALNRGNYGAALPILRKMADEGDAQSQSALATMLWQGMPGVEKDRTQAILYYEKAAQKHNGTALSALGNIYLNGDSVPRNPQKAFEYLSTSVSQGNNLGKIGLAVCYLKGWGTEQDLQKSFNYTREAAYQNVPGAAYNLAYYFRKGIGCDVNMIAAEKWWVKAAPMVIRDAAQHRDSYERQIAAAEIYLNGWGIKKDPAVAASYFKFGMPMLKKAIAEGKGNAIMTMAELTDNGWGVKKDHAAAVEMYKKAASMGDKEADWVLQKAHAQAV